MRLWRLWLWPWLWRLWRLRIWWTLLRLDTSPHQSNHETKLCHFYCQSE